MCKSLDTFVEWWEIQVKNNDDIIISKIDRITDVITHFIDNKIVNDKLINIFINVTLHPLINYVYHLLQRSLRTHVDLIKLHFEYAPNQHGYELAKKDFINNMI